MMKKQDVFEIAVKLLGIYCLLQALAGISHAVLATVMDYSKYFYSKIVYVVIACLSPSLLFVVAWFLLFKGHVIAEFLGRGVRAVHDDEADDTIPLSSRLSFWIVLMGVFNLMSSLPVLISRSLLLVPMRNEPHWWSEIVFHVAVIGVSAVCIWKSEALEQFFARPSWYRRET